MTPIDVGSVIRKSSLQVDLDELHKMADELLELVGGLESRISPVLPQNYTKSTGFADGTTPPDPGKSPYLIRLSELRGKISMVMVRIRFMLDENQL